jgi:hypothetical protein
MGIYMDGTAGENESIENSAINLGSYVKENRSRSNRSSFALKN